MSHSQPAVIANNVRNFEDSRKNKATAPLTDMQLNATQIARNSFRDTHGAAKQQADEYRGARDNAKRTGSDEPDINELSELAIAYYENPGLYFEVEAAVNKAVTEAARGMGK